MSCTLKSLLSDQYLTSSALTVSGDTASVYGENILENLTDDSRKAHINSVFSCTQEGISFAGQAHSNGCRVFLCDQFSHLNLPDDSVVLRVDDFLKVQGYAASLLNGNPSQDLYVVGITGTNGKTTVAHMLYHIWKSLGYNPGMIGTLGVKYEKTGESEVVYGTGYTTPRAGELQSILCEMKKNSITHIAMEVSSEALELGRVYGTKFSASIFTNLTPEHLNFHGNMEAYFRVKMSLMELTSGNMAVYSKGEYGKKALEYINSIDPMRSISIETPFVDNIPVPVLFNRINASLAVSVCCESSEEKNLAVNALASLPPVNGRFEVFRVDDLRFSVVDYAHTSDALENVLRETKNLGAEKICVVFGCGGDRDREKRSLMGKIASELTDLVIVTDDNPRKESPESIRSEIISGIKNKKNVLEISNRKSAIMKSVSWLMEQKVPSACVIAGKGHEEYQLFSDRKEYFSDKECLHEAIADSKGLSKI